MELTLDEIKTIINIIEVYFIMDKSGLNEKKIETIEKIKKIKEKLESILESNTEANLKKIINKNIEYIVFYTEDPVFKACVEAMLQADCWESEFLRILKALISQNNLISRAIKTIEK